LKWSYEAALLLVDYLYYSQNHTVRESSLAAEKLAKCFAARSSTVLIDAGAVVEHAAIFEYVKSYDASTGSTTSITNRFSGLEKDVFLLSEQNYEVFQQQVELARETLSFDGYEPIHEKTGESAPSELSIEDTSYADQLGISSGSYDDMELEELSLSARGLNLLKRSGARSVSDLLSYTPSQLMKMKGLGAGTFHEIEEKLSSLSSIQVNSAPTVVVLESDFHKAHATEICSGDFSWVDEEERTDAQLAIIAAYKNAYSDLGPELATKAYLHDDFCISLIESLASFVEEFNVVSARRAELLKELRNVPKDRWDQNSFGYLRIFAKTDEEIADVKTLANTCPRLRDVAEYSSIGDVQTYRWVLAFIKKVAFDVKEELHDLMQKLFENPRTKTVISMRSRSKTLEETGKVINVTRERARQIEAKAKRQFSYWQNRRHYLMKISALRNCDDILSANELRDYFGDYYTELLYLFRTIESHAFYYDEQLDAFVIGDNTLGSRIQEYVESLPETFSESKLSGYIDTAEEDYDIPRDLLLSSIQDAYKMTGSTYHRSRLSLTSIYTSIFQRFYQNGMHVYDDNEIEKFKQIIIDEYGAIKLPSNSRAITARLCDIGILCGRGIYRPKKKRYISSDLQERIRMYIDDNPAGIFLMNTLFAVFEDDLLSFGIDNKYYLQGVLRELFNDRYIFRRDYLSKDDTATSLYSDIVQFISKSPYPVNKQQIQEAYPGITDIVINISVSDSEVLNFFGEYLHASKLKISAHEKEQLKKIVERIVSDGKTHHVKDVFPLVNKYCESLLSRNAILWPFSLFSVLAYLFEDSFNFERPFIAQKGIKIGRPMEQIRALVHENDYVSLASIVDLAKEAHFTIYSYLDLLNTFSDTHLIADADGLVSIKRSGLDKNYAVQMETMILNEIHDPIPVTSLECIHKFKEIGVSWSDWLIYSAIKKWSSALDVAVTSKYFKQAVPIIGRRGSITQDVIDAFSGLQHTEVSQVDNLDNIDDLIADYVLEDWEDL